MHYSIDVPSEVDASVVPRARYAVSVPSRARIIVSESSYKGVNREK